MKKKKNKKDINSYGSAFWVSMTLASLAVGLLGAVTFAFAVLRIIYGDVWYMWFVLAAAGAGALLLASFCSDLLPYWATTVREMRLLNARISGAMSVSQINKYEEREDKRNTDIKDSMTESFSRVGQDIVSLRSQVAVNDSKMNEIIKTLEEFKKTTSDADYLKQVQDAMKTMSKKLEKYSDYTNSSIKDLQSQIAISKNASDTSSISTSSKTSPAPSIKKIEVIEEVVEKNDESEMENSIKKPTITPSKRKNKEQTEDAIENTEYVYVPMSIKASSTSPTPEATTNSTNSSTTNSSNISDSKKLDDEKKENTEENTKDSAKENTSESGESNNDGNSGLVFPPVEDNIAATSKDYDEINKQLNIGLESLINNDNQPNSSSDSDSSNDDNNENSDDNSSSNFDNIQKELNDYFA